jgi:3-hydroxy-9,10-secoandrosta-1,3,5(10)-triene-9,17-dione monooxygenase
LVRTKAAGKMLAYSSIGRQADSVAFQLLIAEAAMKIDTAHPHIYRVAHDVQRYAEQGEYPDITVRGRMRADAAIALRSIYADTNILLEATTQGVSPKSMYYNGFSGIRMPPRHAVTLPQVSME